MVSKAGMEEMQVLNVKEVPKELMWLVKTVAMQRKQSVKDFVVEILGVAVGYGEKAEPVRVRKEKGPVVEEARVDKGTEFDPAKLEEKVVEAAQCKRCDRVIMRDTKNRKYWYCGGCKRQFDDREVKILP